MPHAAVALPAGRALSTRLSLALLAYMVGVVAVITLLPFRFQSPTLARFLWSGGLVDIVTNVCLFLPLGFLYQLTQHQVDDRWCWRPAMVSGTLSLCIELAQLFLPGRYSTPMDVLANTLGAWLGATLYAWTAQRLQQRLVGQLALELPLMSLFYLLIPLLWLNALSTGMELSRLWLAVLPGLCGGGIVVALWQYRLRPAGVLSANTLALVVGLWFLVGTAPGLAKRPQFLICCSFGVAGIVRLLAAMPWVLGHHARRFELPTLRRIWPLYVTYVCLVALWPWPWGPHAWRISLGFAGVSDIPGIIPTLRFIEYIAAFTLLGYMIAEFRGRQDEAYTITVRWLMASAVLVGGVLEIIRGFHPAHGASVAHLVVATVAVLYGGVLYQLQLTSVQQLLAHTTRSQGEHTSGSAGSDTLHHPLFAVRTAAERTDNR